MACKPWARRLASASRFSCCRMLLAALLLPLLLALVAGHARADEAYVCEGGRVVQVRLGELDRLKRTDPCIAAYYGLSIQASPVSEAAPPLPERRPEVIAAAPAAIAPAPIAAVPIAAVPMTTASVAAAAVVTVPRVERVLFKHQLQRAEPAVVTSSGSVDYRNVVIINAAPGSAAIFRHTR